MDGAVPNVEEKAGKYESEPGVTNLADRPTVCSRLLLEPGGGRLSHISVSRRPGPAPVLVCLCHFRDTVPDLTRKIDSYLKSCEIDGYLVFPLFARPDRPSPFFPPKLLYQNVSFGRTMNLATIPSVYGWERVSLAQLAFDEISSYLRSVYELFSSSKKENIPFTKVVLVASTIERSRYISKGGIGKVNNVAISKRNIPVKSPFRGENEKDNYFATLKRWGVLFIGLAKDS